MVALLGLIKFLPLIGGLVTATWLIITAFAETTQGDQFALIKVFGIIINGADKQITDATNSALAGDTLSLFGVIGGFTMYYLVLWIFMKGINIITSFESTGARFFLAVVIFILVSVAVNAVENGTFQLPGSGALYFFQNFQDATGRISSPLDWFANFSLGNPFI